MTFPKKAKPSVVTILIVALNASVCVSELIDHEWNAAISAGLIAVLFWLWSSERRQAEWLGACIRHAATYSPKTSQGDHLSRHRPD